MTQKLVRFITAAVTGLMILSPLAVQARSAAPLLPDQAVNHIPVCDPGQGGQTAGCFAHVVVDKSGSPQASSLPSGYGPNQLRGAYGVSNQNGSQTIAIVDAYDHPNIKSDLDKYDQTFGLPAFPSCSSSVTTACFQKVDQRGGTAYPAKNAGWALEIALDVEVAHAMCPGCKLILVEADSNSFANLMAAVDRAVTLGANVVSMSWGGSEFSSEASYDSHFSVPGVAFVTSSGDNGYGTSYPAASSKVTSVGGTNLKVDSNNQRTSETVWSGAGSGCSLYEQKPSFQSDSGCNNRMIADVSAVADPATGAAVYDSVRYQGRQGWFKVGGTSLSSPLIGSIYALAGNVSGMAQPNAYPYSHANSLYDVTSGSNGTCSISYFCKGVTGYDGPTGLGTPVGSNAF